MTLVSLKNTQDRCSDTDLWMQAAPLQARLVAENWTIKSHSRVVEGERVYYFTAWRLGLRKGLKGKGSTPLEALRSAYALACETIPPNKFIVPEEWKVHL